MGYITVRSSPLGGSATVRVPVRTVRIFCDIYNIEQTALELLGSNALLTNQFIPFNETRSILHSPVYPAPVVQDNLQRGSSLVAEATGSEWK